MSDRQPDCRSNAQTDANEANHAAIIRELTLPTGWSVPLSDILKQPLHRLDAEHYDPRVTGNAKTLQRLACKMAPLSDFAEIKLPGRFARIWAKDCDHGIPYLNATDLMSYFATGQVAQERFLSHATRTDVESLLLREGMILMTCSGTIGRVFEVTNSLDGYAGTHDLVRITPNDPGLGGFLRFWLVTDMAQTQILSHTHGGQIDHVTAEQIASCLIPVLSSAHLKEATKLISEADALRERAMKTRMAAITFLSRVVSDAK